LLGGGGDGGIPLGPIPTVICGFIGFVIIGFIILGIVNGLGPLSGGPGREFVEVIGFIAFGGGGIPLNIGGGPGG